ncbi:MAG: VanZ family protein [Gammaproteobacteria bacterium]|nr:VanZ family protein [Gammaproteobacteria bacterium]
MIETTHLVHFKFWMLVGLTLIIVVVYLSLMSMPVAMPAIKIGDKLSHLLAYGVLMAWFGQLYPSRLPQFLWFVGFCLMGVGLEILQGLGGNRYFEYADMLANTAGAALGWWLTRGWFAGALHRFERLFFASA